MYIFNNIDIYIYIYKLIYICIYLYINTLQYAWRILCFGHNIHRVRIDRFDTYLTFNVQMQLPEVYHENYYALDEGTLDEDNRTLSQRLKEDMDAETLLRGGVFFICPICFDKKTDAYDKYMKYCCGQIICKACWHSHEEECRRKSRKPTCEFCRSIHLGPKGSRQWLIDHGE